MTQTVETKTAIITGANSGIGKITSLQLLKKGYRIGMICRSAEKAEAAREEIIRESGNTAAEIFICDLSSMQQIRTLSEKLRKSFPVLDLLVNNAGMLPDSSRKITAEGLEVTFATNHLSYFLLTKELLVSLKASASARVVSVASEAHRSGRFEPDNLQLERGYNTFKAYGNSKLFNIMFARQLATELKDTQITSYSLHPGVVNTNFASKSDSLFAKIFNLGRFFMISPEKGSETTLFLCTEPGIEHLNGRYFVKSKPAKPTVKDAYDDQKCKELWDLSEKIT
ncbi:MAG: SDR family oxidoreductase, partial [Balneolaceae bacterium]